MGQLGLKQALLLPRLGLAGGFFSVLYCGYFCVLIKFNSGSLPCCFSWFKKDKTKSSYILERKEILQNQLLGQSTKCSMHVIFPFQKEYIHYKQLKGWKHLVVYKSGIHGLGLYTSVFIPRGSMVIQLIWEFSKKSNYYPSSLAYVQITPKTSLSFGLVPSTISFVPIYPLTRFFFVSVSPHSS